jgi:hypothetical protein
MPRDRREQRGRRSAGADADVTVCYDGELDEALVGSRAKAWDLSVLTTARNVHLGASSSAS